MSGLYIKDYYLPKELACDNSGFSKWGIGERHKEPFFIKEFLSPVYPFDKKNFTESVLKQRQEDCERYVAKAKKLYDAIREVNDGNLVVIEEFFRVNSKYYISTKAISEKILTIEEISTYSFEERLKLCCIVAHSIANLHSENIIHADIKPDNILIYDNAGLKAKIIDFDCSFFLENRPQKGEDLSGDFVYLSPEAFCHMAEIDEFELTCKMDVFALGIVFCQYLTGYLPKFDISEYQYAYEPVLDDVGLNIDMIENYYCKHLIGQMLQKDPEQRPSMQQVFQSLQAILFSTLGIAVDGEVDTDNTEALNDNIPDENRQEDVLKEESKGKGFFFIAGDL